MNDVICKEALELFEKKDHFRIVAFGASNTERYMPGIHWTDVLETALRVRCGRKFQLINSGISGNTTRQAVERFDQDVAFYQPHLVIVTFGGNDCVDPSKNRDITEEEYRSNLETIGQKIRALGAIPVFQTYYKMDSEALDKPYAERVIRNMQIIREVAQANNFHLVDQYAVFDKIEPWVYRYKLMLNPAHTNENGNILIGLELLRHFDLQPEKIYHNEKITPWITVHQKAVEALS